MPFFGKVRDRNYEEPATPFSNKIRTLKSQLQRELDNSRARAEGQDTSEIATADIADRIITIGVVEEIEQVSTKLQGFRFCEREAPGYREVHILLSWSAQCVAPNVAKIGAVLARECG
jgi:hypothetical protein